MKRGLLFGLLPLLLSFAIVQADDVGISSAPAKVTQNDGGYVRIGIYWNNADTVQGASVGLRVSATGAATVEFDETFKNPAAVNAAARGGTALSQFGWQWKFSPTGSTSPDTNLVGGNYLPGVLAGVFPDNSSETLYWVDLFFAGYTGPGFAEQICFDSCSLVAPGGTWLIDCGSGNTNPTFNGGQGSYCIPYEHQACQAPAFVTVPPGDVLSLDHCTGGQFQFTADPVETNPPQTLDGFDMVSGDGAIDDNGLYTVGAGAVGTSLVTVRVFNTCPNQTDYTFTLNYTNAGLQYTNCPTSSLQASMGKTFVWDLGLDNFDCDAIAENWSVISYTGAGTGVPVGTIDVTDGVFTYNTVSDDVGTWVFEVSADDGFGETANCQFTFEVTSGSTWGIRIAKIGEAPDFVFQGHYAILPVYLDYMGSDPMGGFDFLIAYDASALTMISAERGEAISCWEYFNYRNGPFGTCTGMCPSGQLRVVAMAESNNGPYHPTGCDGEDGIFNTPDAELVRIKFYVTDDRTYECQFIPVYFFWMDCGDNAISNWTGNTLYIANHVYNLNWVDPNNPYFELIPSDGTIDENDRIYGAFEWCDDNPDPTKPIPIRDIDFFNGGIDIACANEIDLRADLNLNNLAYEIADAVLYTNYFIYGPAVFDINYEGQVAASDVNNDGRALTVGDLVYLIRVLTGDATPIEKLSPFAHTAVIDRKADVVSLQSPVDVGAALFIFDGEATVENLTELDMLADVVDGQTRVLIYSIGKNHVDAGTTDLLAVNGDVVLSEVEISDYYGSTMMTTVNAKAVPKAFALYQNYPNPFNPATEVAFDLPEAADWSVDIYNVSGRLVKSYSGYSDVGVVRINVDASGWASGIYLYRVTANDFTASKKMVLMK